MPLTKNSVHPQASALPRVHGNTSKQDQQANVHSHMHTLAPFIEMVRRDTAHLHNMSTFNSHSVVSRHLPNMNYCSPPTPPCWRLATEKLCQHQQTQQTYIHTCTHTHTRTQKCPFTHNARLGMHAGTSSMNEQLTKLPTHQCPIHPIGFCECHDKMKGKMPRMDSNPGPCACGSAICHSHE